jgi:predicted Zn-dependent peptidase
MKKKNPVSIMGKSPTVYRKSTLPNGIRLVTEELPYSQAVSLGVWLEVGSRDEAVTENGLSHFLEHMAFKGTARRSAYDIALEIDQLGGLGNAFTTRENTCFHIKVLEGQTPQAVDLLIDIAIHPLCQPEDVERERTVILEEIAAQEDTPEELVQVHFAREFWRGCALGRSILGEAEDISRFSREDLLAYRRATYRPENIVVAGAGNLNHQNLLDLLGPALEVFKNGAPSRKREPATTHPGGYLFNRELEQAHLCLGTRGLPAGDEQRFVASLLHIILGGNMSSRLFQVIREELGLAYTIYSYLSFLKDTGLLEICAGVSPKNLPALLAAVNGELHRLKSAPVEKAELAAAKEYVKSSVILNAEDSEQRMLRLAKNEINFGHYIPLTDIIAGVEKVTADEVQELARGLLQPSNWGMAVLGPVNADLPFGNF